jgi:phosphatidate phosphatase APP1
VVGDDVDFGIVSDIDDTVITTWLPRLLVATYNTFVLAEEARTPVEGMSDLYAALLADRPGAPTVYVSTGPWNAARALSRFRPTTTTPAAPCS